MERSGELIPKIWPGTPRLPFAGCGDTGLLTQAVLFWTVALTQFSDAGQKPRAFVLLVGTFLWLGTRIDCRFRAGTVIQLSDHCDRRVETFETGLEVQSRLLEKVPGQDCANTLGASWPSHTCSLASGCE